ncbi:hypothetical protein V6N13_091745 [Hibiscus sabdariffa]|uniref:TFIIS N-terminal domain-containing protein n=1 Tax=Hibiscus sabdariffa TaxID=183260 RepID=A0ABR2QF39_9ROSI
MMLHLLTDILSKKHLEQEFLDGGVLSLFKNWLERPDGSLPNATIRASILSILTPILPIHISSEDPNEKLKRSKLGKVIMFMSKSEEETNSNRQLTKDLVENCSRTIFNKNARGSDLKNKQEEVVIPLKKPSAMKVKEVDLALKSHPKQSSSSAASGSRQGVSVPKPAHMVNTQSNYNLEIPRGCLRYEKPRDCKCYKRIEKNMRKLKNSKRKPLQATKLN